MYGPSRRTCRQYLVEKSRGYMPGVSVNPGRLLFHCRHDRASTRRTMVPGAWLRRRNAPWNACRPFWQRAGANFAQVIKQVLYIADMEAHAASGRAVRAGIFRRGPPSLHGAWGCAASPILPCSSEIETGGRSP